MLLTKLRPQSVVQTSSLSTLRAYQTCRCLDPPQTLQLGLIPRVEAPTLRHLERDPLETQVPARLLLLSSESSVYKLNLTSSCQNGVEGWGDGPVIKVLVVEFRSPKPM